MLYDVLLTPWVCLPPCWTLRGSPQQDVSNTLWTAHEFADCIPCLPYMTNFCFSTLSQLHERELVVFAVNDNPEVDVAAGGAHW